MVIEYRPSNIVLPNITVQEKYSNDVLVSYVLTANDGYVMYDTTATDTEPKIDEETGETIEVPVTYYFRQATYPVRVPVENWTYVAVLESTVDENYIFGGGGNDSDHEIA